MPRRLTASRITSSSNNDSSPRRPRLRIYNRVAAIADDEGTETFDENFQPDNDVESGPTQPAGAPRRLFNQRLRRNNNNPEEITSLTGSSGTGDSISSGADEITAEEEETAMATSNAATLEQSDYTSREDLLSLIILDFTHQKFSVSVPKDATVLQLKQSGMIIHKVPPGRQRLIYQGRLLEDDVLLKDANINTDGLIVHLFPKPRVVVVNDNKRGNKSTCTPAEDEGQMEQEHGARVPTIVMDAEEAERRSQILVLGSVDYMEAQNNVKLFSFMLLIISSIELLNLFAIAMGVPQDVNALNNSTGLMVDPTDMMSNVDDDFIFDDENYNFDQLDNVTFFNNTSYGNSSSSNTTWNNDTMAATSSSVMTAPDPAVMIYQQWSPLSWVDLVISVLGVYVACLGIKATNENQLRFAKFYLWGTCIVAVAWLAYNYVVSLRVDEAIEHQQEQAKERYQQQHNDTSSDDDYDWNNPYSNEYYGHDLTDENLYSQAFQVMILPAMVWLLCVFRAWQFQYLLQEAEHEAANRIQQELQLNNADDEEQPANDNEAEGFSLHNSSAEVS